MISPLTISVLALIGGSIAQTPVKDNKWLVKDLLIQRYPNGSKAEFGVEFELVRNYYKECIPGPVSQAFEQGSWECGWLRAAQSLKCNNWVGDERSSGTVPSDERNAVSVPSDDSGFYSCKSYLHAAPGEEAIPESVRNRVRWRVYDLKEATTPRNRTVFPTQFQSFKMEIVHGVPHAQ
jgi:hypothetical protein